MPELPLNQLIADPSVHGRARVRVAAVRQYAQVREPLPPVSAFRDSSGRYWLADGFLRYYARHSTRQPTIEVEVHSGERRDAIRFACGANARHGQPRSRQDRRLTAAAVLLAPEFGRQSDAEIADLCAVSRSLVAELRPHCASYERFAEFQAQERRRQDEMRQARQEHHRQQLAKHTRAPASPAAAPADPAPTVPAPAPEPDRPLTPREQAQAALARAAAAVKRAKQAMIVAAEAYPEARCDSSFDAVNESQCHLEDLGVKREAGQGEGRDEKKNTTKSHPCNDLESLARYFSNPAHCDAFLHPPTSGPIQPETLHPSPRGIASVPARSNDRSRPRPPPDD